jgi:hypothetical protein
MAAARLLYDTILQRNVHMRNEGLLQTVQNLIPLYHVRKVLEATHCKKYHLLSVNIKKNSEHLCIHQVLNREQFHKLCNRK